MGYTIGEVSDRTGLSIHTLRFYEKEGIMPTVGRSEGGKRLYETRDIEAIEFVCCLRATGMAIADIKEFVERNKTIDELIHMLEQQKQKVQAQIDQFTSHQEMLDRKIALYRNGS